MKKLLTALLMMMTIMMMAIPVSAKLIKVPKKLYIEYDASGWTIGDSIDSWNNRFPVGCKIKNIKVSNKKIIKAYASTMHYVNYDGTEATHPYLQIDGRRTGSCTLSFDVVLGDIKEHYSVKVSCRKYVSPIASLRINGKEYAPSMKNYNYLKKTLRKNTNYKIQIKAKKNWKLKGIYNGNNWDQKFKNGGIVRFKSGKNNSLHLFFVNKKTKKEKILSIGRTL